MGRASVWAASFTMLTGAFVEITKGRKRWWKSLLSAKKQNEISLLSKCCLCVILLEPKFKSCSICLGMIDFCSPNFTVHENHPKFCQRSSSYDLCIYFIPPTFLGDESLESFSGARSLSLPAQRWWCYGPGCGGRVRTRLPTVTLPSGFLTLSPKASQGLSQGI